MTKESKLTKGDFVKVDTADGEHLGEYQHRDENFTCLKGEGEYIYIPNDDVIIIRKPFVTIENPAT